MRVGQWCRFKDYEDGWKIGKITEIQDDCFFVDTANYTSYKSSKYKSADNLVDLLEIGDIIHYETKFFKDDAIIRSENAIRLVKEDIKNNKLKITAIELHENRVKQVISCE